MGILDEEEMVGMCERPITSQGAGAQERIQFVRGTTSAKQNAKVALEKLGTKDETRRILTALTCMWSQTVRKGFAGTVDMLV